MSPLYDMGDDGSATASRGAEWGVTARLRPWPAFGTVAQVAVDDRRVAGRAQLIAERVTTAVDASCNRLRPDSDLNRASAAAGSWVQVDPLLVQAVEAGIRAARLTGGLVDPTLGDRLAELGYDRELRLVRAAARSDGGAAQRLELPPLPSAHAAARWLEIETDGVSALRVPAGCTLDLGVTAKAFAADTACKTISDELGCSVVVSVGRDVSASCVDERTGWHVQVGAGADGGADDQVITLRNGGLATTTIRHRRWQWGGMSLHHILDPRTGMPSDGAVTSATVCAPSCVEANAASAAAVVLGGEAQTWLENHDLSALLQLPTGAAVRCAGWPAPALVGALC